MNLRGFPQNAGYGPVNLERGQLLVMKPEVDNEHDKYATVVKTLDGNIVGRVALPLSKSARKMMQNARKLGIDLHPTFIKLNEVEVTERGGKRYLEDQPEIQVDFGVTNNSSKKVRASLVSVAIKWKGIEFVEVEEEDLREPEAKRGNHVGFGDIIGESGDELEGGNDLPNHKRLKRE